MMLAKTKSENLIPDWSSGQQRTLDQTEKRMILERAWDQGILDTSANYKLVSELSQKTRKQVRDWCAQKRRKIRLSKEGTTEQKKRKAARKRRREEERMIQKSVRLNQLCQNFQINFETQTLLDNAWVGGILRKRDSEMFQTVATLANVSGEVLTRYVAIRKEEKL